MSKAAIARLAVAVLGTVLTGYIALEVGLGTAAMLIVIVVGFVVTSSFAESAFRSMAAREEIRRDLEDRVRNSD